MERLAVDFPYTLSNTAAQLGTGLIHGQQNTGDLKLGVEFFPHRFNQFQHFRDTLAGQEMGLDRNDTVVRRCQCVDGQKLMLQSTVDEDVVVGGTQMIQQLGHDLFAGPPGIPHSVVLRELHNLEPGSGIRQPAISRNQVNAGICVDDSFLQMEVQIFWVVDGSQQEIGQRAGLFSGGVAHRRCKSLFKIF